MRLVFCLGIELPTKGVHAHAGNVLKGEVFSLTRFVDLEDTVLGFEQGLCFFLSPLAFNAGSKSNNVHSFSAVFKVAAEKFINVFDKPDVRGSQLGSDAANTLFQGQAGVNND